MAYDDLDTGLAIDKGRDASPRSVTAFFDTEEAADKARDDLIQAGVPKSEIRVAGRAAPEAAPQHPHGFWESLMEFFMPDEDRHLYAEGLRRGGFALSVGTDSAAYDHVIEILDRDGAVDMEERSAGWRDEGWSGTPASSFSGAISTDERALLPAGSGTAGFAASRADQPLFDGPLDTAAIEPGQVAPAPLAGEQPASERSRIAATAPDTAYAAAAPGLASPADPERDETARPGELQREPGRLAATPVEPTPTRDMAHGRTRVRSYLTGRPGKE